MKSVAFSPKAQEELEAIGDYIAPDNPGRAFSFVRELRARAEAIANAPNAYPPREDVAKGLRMADHKPYMILFRVLPAEIRIERIIHGARDLPRLLHD